MVYVPNPTDGARPLNSDPAESAAPEFRALKAYLQGVLPIGVGGLNFFRKNRTTNGDFSIDQRHEGASGGACNQTANYVVDHLVAYAPAASTVTCRQTGSVAGSQPSFWATLNVTVSSAALAAEKFGFETAIEGQNIADLQWGTAQALPISLSFLIDSPAVGTHCVALKNSAGTRSYVATFQVPIANVVTLVQLPNIPGCTDGVWTTDATIGIDIFVDAGCGANFEAPAANAWQVGNYNRIAGAAKGGSINASVFKIAYLQLEQAVAVSSFEQITFSEKLARCQRYYEKSFKPGDVPSDGVVGVTYPDNFVTTIVSQAGVFPQWFVFGYKATKRAAPTIVLYNPKVGGGAGVPTDVTSGVDMTSSTVLAGLNRTLFQGRGGSAAGNEAAVNYTASADFW